MNNDAFWVICLAIVIGLMIVGLILALSPTPHYKYQTDEQAIRAACAHHSGTRSVYNNQDAICVDGTIVKITW